MPSRLLRWCGGLCLVACSTTRAPETDTGRKIAPVVVPSVTTTEPRTPIPPERPPLFDLRRPWPLLVAGPHGIGEVDETGKMIRVHTTSFAVAPRAPSLEGIWFLSPIAEHWEVRHLSVQGDERVLAKVPRWYDVAARRFGASAGAVELLVHERSDFVVPPPPARMCLTLSDRNQNMRLVQVDLRIERDTGQLEYGILSDFESSPLPPCSEVPSTPPRGGSSLSHWYDERTGELHSRQRGIVVARLRGAGGEPAERRARSPSGVLELLFLFRALGDYAHFTPVVLDLRTGRLVWFVDDQPLPTAVRDGLPNGTSGWDVVAETDAFFVDERHAVVGRHLIVFPPGPINEQKIPHIVALPGDAVRGASNSP